MATAGAPAGRVCSPVVTLRHDREGRQYRVPSDEDYKPVWRAQKRLKEMGVHKLPNGLNAVPDEVLPPVGTLGFRVQRYGMLQWGDLFTKKQQAALLTLAKHVRSHGVPAIADALL